MEKEAALIPGLTGEESEYCCGLAELGVRLSLRLAGQDAGIVLAPSGLEHDIAKFVSLCSSGRGFGDSPGADLVMEVMSSRV